MINILVRTAIKKLAFKIATDKSLRNKVKTGISNAKELNSQGELIKSLGKVAGRKSRSCLPVLPLDAVASVGEAHPRVLRALPLLAREQRGAG
mgnify:CR=1 FL=1